MPRKGNIAKRDVLADPVYNSKLVTKLITRFASAILWTSSRFLTAEPVLLAASIISFARRSSIVCSLRKRAYETSHLKPAHYRF